MWMSIPWRSTSPGCGKNSGHNRDFELRTIRGFGYMGMLREDEDAQS